MAEVSSIRVKTKNWFILALENKEKIIEIIRQESLKSEIKGTIVKKVWRNIKRVEIESYPKTNLVRLIKKKINLRLDENSDLEIKKEHGKIRCFSENIGLIITSRSDESSIFIKY